jgi:REP element-mobilizing transposase RayT
MECILFRDPLHRAETLLLWRYQRWPNAFFANRINRRYALARNKEPCKNVELDNYVIMPNHIHGIITLNNNNHCVGTSYRQGAIKTCLVPTKTTKTNTKR